MRDRSPILPGVCFLILLMIHYTMPQRVLACRCSSVITPRAAYQRAHLVVTGKVITVKPNADGNGTTAIVTASKAWKKTIHQELAISTRTTCAFEFKPGQEYLLYLYETKAGGYYTARCLGNQSLSTATRASTWLNRHGTAGDIE